MSKDLVKTKKQAFDLVTKRIKSIQENKEIALPENYSPENAMKSAWLALQGVTAKNDQNKYVPALEYCSQESIANSLLDMVIQGLSPAKKQCYFIAYKKTLNLQRSYFGDLSIMQRLNGVKSVNSNVVYKDDKFSIIIEPDGSKSIKHETGFEALNSEIIGAYCIINFDNGNRHIEVMSIEQIHKSWDKGTGDWKKPDRFGNYGPHITFPEEMAKRTVIRRACKLYINTSDDSDLLIETFNKTTETEYKNTEREVETEVEEKQATIEIDVEEEVGEVSSEITEEDVSATVEELETIETEEDPF